MSRANERQTARRVSNRRLEPDAGDDPAFECDPHDAVTVESQAVRFLSDAREIVFGDLALRRDSAQSVRAPFCEPAAGVVGDHRVRPAVRREVEVADLQIAADPKYDSSSDVGGPDMLPCCRDADWGSAIWQHEEFGIACGVPSRECPTLVE